MTSSLPERPPREPDLQTTAGQFREPAATDSFLSGYDGVHFILLVACVVLGFLSVLFQRRVREAEQQSENVIRVLNSKMTEIGELKTTINQLRLPQRTTSVQIEYRIPSEVSETADRLRLGIRPLVDEIRALRDLLEPHARLFSSLPEFDSKLRAARTVMMAGNSSDQAVAAMQTAQALLTTPELASEGLLRDLLNDLLRAQRRREGVSLDQSRALATALAQRCRVEFFVPEVGQPFDKNIHQAVGDSTTSAFREPVIKRVVSGGLREPKSGHIGMRADVEIG
jgi:hypothetical protein